MDEGGKDFFKDLAGKDTYKPPTEVAGTSQSSDSAAQTPDFYKKVAGSDKYPAPDSKGGASADQGQPDANSASETPKFFEDLAGSDRYKPPTTPDAPLKAPPPPAPKLPPK